MGLLRQKTVIFTIIGACRPGAVLVMAKKMYDIYSENSVTVPILA